MVNATHLRFGERAVHRGYITPVQLTECLRIQSMLKEHGISRMIGAILQEKGYLNPDQVESLIFEMGSDVQQPIKGYQILEKLGKGGMGVVYKAVQESLDRTVALKVLPNMLANDSQYLQRFIREAKSAATLNHPNVVQALDVNESNGYYYFAMEYVDGMTVRQRLEEGGTFSEQDALEVIYQIALALDHAQKNSIVHRDIKPDNIMLSKDGTAKLCDLGLAKSIAVDGSLTQTGVAIGTPFYISPEQAKGAEKIDIRSDIYSLGVTLFHMLTGSVPFKGSTPIMIIAKHINESVPDPRVIRGELSQGISDLTLWMTARDIDARCQSPTALIEAIESIIIGNTPKLGGTTRKTRLWRKGTTKIVSGQMPAFKPKNNRKLILIASAAIAALLLILIGLDFGVATYRYKAAVVSLPEREQQNEYDEAISDLETARPWVLPVYLSGSIDVKVNDLKEKQAAYEKEVAELERKRLAELERKKKEQEEKEKLATAEKQRIEEAELARRRIIEKQLEDAWQFEKKGEYERAHALIADLFRNEELAKSPLLKDVNLPFPVKTDPPGAAVSVDGEVKGQTPFILYLSPLKENVKFSISKKGFYPLDFELSPMEYADYSGIELMRAPIWSYPPKDSKAYGKVTAGPVVEGDRLYFSAVNADGQRVVVALEAETGKRIWEAKIPTEKDLGVPVAAKTYVFVGDGSGKLYRFSRDTGDKLKTFEPTGGAAITAGPMRMSALADILLVGTEDGKIFQLSVWHAGKGPELDLGRPVSRMVELGGSYILVSDTDGLVRFYDPRSDSFIHSPIRLDGALIAATSIDKLGFLASSKGELHAVDLTTGAALWTYREHKVASELVAAGNNIFFLDGSGALHSITHTKAHRWTALLKDNGARGVHISGASGESSVFVTTTKPFVVAYSAKTGEERCRYEPPMRVVGTVCCSGEYVYLATAGGRIYNYIK
ncbi:MAG: protein kinase domain-containing protein [Planctomycetota bacterium]|jgi:serine/threonine-protein kinase